MNEEDQVLNLDISDLSPEDSLSQATNVDPNLKCLSTFLYQNFKVKDIKSDLTALFYNQNDRKDISLTGWKLNCLACGDLVQRHKTTRTNLSKHYRGKHEGIVKFLEQKADSGGSSLAGTSSQRSIRSFMKDAALPYSDRVFETKLIKWVVNDDQSFLVVENSDFMDMVLHLNSSAKLFGAHFDSNDHLNIFNSI